eukprot:COSAG01_NODE_280_length_19520_cov_9.720406_9_plen_676_part_00
MPKGAPGTGKSAAEEGLPPSWAPLEISPDDAHRMIDTMTRNARGNIALPALLAELGGWGEQLRGFEAGQASGSSWVALPKRQEPVNVSSPWQPPRRGVVVDNSKMWGEAWQVLGSAEPEDALTLLGCFTRLVCGKPFSLISTKYMDPARQWAEMVKREEEARHGAPCFNPNEDNINLAQLEGEDQSSRDGRWLLVFKWCTKVAAFTGGRMIQLRIPGFGLSPMQMAEEQIAAECGLFVEKRVLDVATGARLANLPADDLGSLICEGSITKAKMEAWITRLSDGDVATAEAATKALAVLALEADKAVAIFQAGGVEPLVTLLSKGSAGAPEHAANALARLACNADNEVAIVQAGALPPLIALLSEGSAEARKEAAKALGNLAVNADNKVTVVQAGALAPLIALLSQGSAGAQECAATALMNLASNADNQVAIVQAGALPPLIALLSEGSVEARRLAAGALRNLSVNTGNQTAIVRAGALAPLIALLSQGSAGTQEMAAKALSNLATSNVDNQVAIVQAGALPPLIALLSEDSARVREWSAVALRNLSVNTANRAVIVRAGALAPLIALLSDGSVGAQVAVAAALANLACSNTDSQLAVAVVVAGGAEAVVGALQARPSVPALQEWGVKALYNMTLIPEGKAAVRTAGGRQAAENAAKAHPGHSCIQEWSANLIKLG